jgi:hypothetical protein
MKITSKDLINLNKLDNINYDIITPLGKTINITACINDNDILHKNLILSDARTPHPYIFSYDFILSSEYIKNFTILENENDILTPKLRKLLHNYNAYYITNDSAAICLDSDALVLYEIVNEEILKDGLNNEGYVVGTSSLVFESKEKAFNEFIDIKNGLKNIFDYDKGV